MSDKKEIEQNASSENLVDKNELMQTSLLTMLEKLQKKQLFYQRISCFLILLLVVAMLSIIPTLLNTLNKASEVMENANSALAQAETTLKDVSDLAATTEEQMAEAMAKITSIDFEGLNKGIEDLQSVIKPLSNFFEAFN